MGSGVSRFGANQKLKKHSKICETTWKDSNSGQGNFKERIKEIYQSLHKFDELPFKERQEYRTRAGDALVEKNCIRIICQHLCRALSGKTDGAGTTKVFLHKLTKKGKKGKQEEDEEEKSVLELTFEALVLVTEPDCSAKACEEVLKQPDLLTALLARLESIHEKEKTFEDKVIFREGITIVHNLTVYRAECSEGYDSSASTDDMISDTDLTTIAKIFESLVTNDNKEIKLLAVTTMACMAHESQDSPWKIEDHHKQFMCLNLSMAFNEGNHRGLRCSVTAMERGIRHLLNEGKGVDEPYQEETRHKNNPAEYLVQCGVLRLLTEGVKSEVMQERKACLEAMWILVCSTAKTMENCQAEMAQDDSFVQLLVKLYDDISNRTIQELAELLLSNLYKHHGIEKPKNLTYGGSTEGKAVEIKKSGDQDRNAKHVMLSYQWESKKMVQQIKERLEKEKIKTWMDVDKMSDAADVNDAMSGAVQEASIFLMGVSKKYHDSPNCKKEANYAEVCRIPIIPLMLQANYEPRGWLGLLKGNRFHFEFHGSGPHEVTLKSLVQRIKSQLKMDKDAPKSTNTTKDPDSEKKEVLPSKSPRQKLWVSPYCRLNPYAACSSRDDGFAHCCCVHHDPKKELRDWAKDNKLDGKEYKSLTRTDLDTLLLLKEQAPDFFYKRIWEDFSMSKMSDVRTFDKALVQWKKKQERKKAKNNEQPPDSQEKTDK